MSAKIDLTNSNHGYLIVKDVNKVMNTHIYWNVYCSYCNKDRVINSVIILRGIGKCRWCTKRVFTYLEAKQIVKEYVNTDINLKDISAKYRCSSKAIYSAIKLIRDTDIT